VTVFLTDVEAAERLKIDKVAMQKLLRRGVVRGFKVGKHWRTTDRALEEFADSKMRAPVVAYGQELPSVASLKRR
jgi:excisionase family DNA binding protein